MTTFTLKVDTDNAAFADDPSPELARILRAVAERIESGDEYHHHRTILDVNGNDVGRFALKRDDGSPGYIEATQTCEHCGRHIVKRADGAWIDPEATGDDSIWRETCDAHDTFVADHEPAQ